MVLPFKVRHMLVVDYSKVVSMAIKYAICYLVPFSPLFLNNYSTSLDEEHVCF